MMTRVLTLTLTTLLCGLALTATAATSNISATNKYAWSETGGWLNAAATDGGVSVYDDHLEGFLWAENLAWIKLGSYTGGGYFTYANSSNSDWGVNLSGAALSGYAWSETAGWINFAPTGGGVSIDPASGAFSGYAWGENVGWLHFNGAASDLTTYQTVFAPSPQVSAIVVDAADGQKMQAAVAGSGIHLSSDAGATWSPATSQPTDRRLKATVVDPATPTTRYAATYGSGVFKSTNSGGDWSACANTDLNPNVYSLVIASDGTLYAGTRGGVFVSSDCAVWAALNSGLPNSAGLYRQSVLAIDPLTPSTLYVGLDGAGIYSSSDSGASWTAATSQPGNTAIRGLLIKPGETSRLYAASYGGGVFTSSNSGADWVTCSNTGLSDLNVSSLNLDNTTTLYAGTLAGIFVSSDHGENWTAMNTGLPE